MEEREERPEEPKKKKLNGWQVFVGEKVDNLREQGATFAEASANLKEQWRSLETNERTAYNETKLERRGWLWIAKIGRGSLK